MALTNCPECQKDVSDMAKICPHCGFKLKKVFQKKNVEKSNSILPVLCVFFIIALLIVTLIFVIIDYISTAKKEEKTSSIQHSIENKPDPLELTNEEKYPLFTCSVENKADPYGLSNENNILGKDIDDVLEGYIEGEDYDLTTTEYFYSYSFPLEIDYIIGKNPYLIIYTSTEDNEINMIEYVFSIDFFSLNSSRYQLLSVDKTLSDYYRVEPYYTCTSNYEIYELSAEDFRALLADEYEALFHATWETKQERVTLFFNASEGKPITGSISFTENQINILNNNIIIQIFCFIVLFKTTIFIRKWSLFKY